MSYPSYKDDFDKNRVDPAKWRERQIDPHQISFTNDAASGAGAIRVTVADGDNDDNCTKPCQRAELRAHGTLRPRHDDEFWHGFAFRVSGDIATTGSLRTVIGQWKAPGDHSPFLAQRFDNGVFHVTVQDGPRRRVVASAEGDPDRLHQFQDLVAKMSATRPDFVRTAHATSRLKAAHLLDASFAPAFDGGADAAEIQKLSDEFCYIEDVETLCAKAGFKTRPTPGVKLPDPKKGWVRMAYRIKPGRDDNNPEWAPRREGEIDIYANGVLIAEIRGDLGYKLMKAPDDDTVYFKFGVYRDLTPGTLRFDFDEFWQDDHMK